MLDPQKNFGKNFGDLEMKLNKEQLINIIKEELELGQQNPSSTMKGKFEEKLYRSLKETEMMFHMYEKESGQYIPDGGYLEKVQELVIDALKHLEQQRAELRKPRTRGVAPDF